MTMYIRSFTTLQIMRFSIVSYIILFSSILDFVASMLDFVEKLKLFSSFFFLFMQKHIYNGHINKIKISKTEMHITVIRCKATTTPEIKLKEKKLQN